MLVTLGKRGLTESYQEDFPETTKCAYCGNIARVAMVGIEEDSDDTAVICEHNPNDGGSWLHDLCAVAIYICEDCADMTTLYNQC